MWMMFLNLKIKIMQYSFSVNLYDRDGDKFDDSILVHVGEDTIIKFGDVGELEKFAYDILASLSEIRDNQL